MDELEDSENGVICNCWQYCKGGKIVAQRTRQRHTQLQRRQEQVQAMGVAGPHASVQSTVTVRSFF